MLEQFMYVCVMFSMQMSYDVQYLDMEKTKPSIYNDNMMKIENRDDDFTMLK